MSGPTDKRASCTGQFAWLAQRTEGPSDRRATNFYVWDSKDAAESFFSEELRDRVTGLYGVSPTIDFVEIAEIVDNSGS